MGNMDKIPEIVCTKRKYKLESPLWNLSQSVQSSQRIWPFYYSAQEKMMFRSYREDWHSKKEYQFDSYQGDDEQVFAYDPIERNIALEYVPKDTVTVDVVATTDRWRVYNHCSRTPTPEPRYEPIDFQSFVQTQPEYISQ